MRSIAQICAALIAAALIMVVEALLVDPEVTGAALLVTAFLAPSVLVCALVDRTRRIERLAKVALFTLTLLPISIAMIHSMLTIPEANAPAKYFLICYLSGGITACAVLVLMPARRGGM